MERSFLGIFVAFVILAGTAAIISLFLVGRTPTGMPVVAPGELSAASDRILIRDLPFEAPIRSTAAGDRRIGVRTHIAAGHRLVDIGFVRLAVPAPPERRVAWERLRRDPDVARVDAELKVDTAAGPDPAERGAAPDRSREPIDDQPEEPGQAIGRGGDGPLDLRIRRHPGAPGWSFELAGTTFEIVGDRLRTTGDGPRIDLSLFGPGRWTLILDPGGSARALLRGE